MFLLILLAGLLITSCEMGLGPSIDLEPPSLKVTRITLPSGEVLDIEEDNKLFIGPGIRVGPGFVLEGEASDNVQVEQILVEEVDKNSNVIPGKKWSSAIIGGRAADGKQVWSITLDDPPIEQGERVIRITAYDRPKNIGPDTVKQLTLLVDTEPPIIESIKIERNRGMQVVDLLPRLTLAGLEIDQYEHVDYLQNEAFTIRAAVYHDYSLSDVTLNFHNEAGQPLFGNGLQRSSGSLYAPVWDITAADLIKINPEYASGRHYFNVSITARAVAGHSGQRGDITNQLYSLCWYPEADSPRIQWSIEEMNESDAGVLVEKGGILPAKVFDDDNVGEVYADLIPAEEWANYMSGKSNAEKLDALIKERTAGTTYTFPFQQINLLSEPTRNTVVTVEINHNRGDYQMVILVRDDKSASLGAIPGEWSAAIHEVQVIEEGIPVITIASPAENNSPALENYSQFTITGTILNLDAVEFLKIAWMPDGLGANVEQQITRGQAALKENGAGTHGGIRIWQPQLKREDDRNIGDKVLREYSFSQTFDIFEDFKFNNVLENAPKFFILYTQSAGSAISSGIDVFKTFRLMAYNTPPDIVVITPNDFQQFGQDQPINFTIRAWSEFGVPIESVTLSLNGIPIPLEQDLEQGNDVWIATDSHHDRDDYGYDVTVIDRLGNRTQRDIYVTVTDLPVFEEVTSPHNNGTQFSSRDIITVYVRFDRAINDVNIPTGTPVPTVELTGFTDEDPRYAHYTEGAGSTTLTFVYDIQSIDKTTGVLKAEKIHLNGAYISGNFGNVVNGVVTLDNHSTAANNLAAKGLIVDGIPPQVTSITFVNADGLEYSPWHKAGNELTIEVTIDKPVRVLGNPSLKLPFSNATRHASFQASHELPDGTTTLDFSYSVQDGDLQIEAVRCNTTGDVDLCFSEDDLEMITDTVGAKGNFLVLAETVTQTGDAQIDAVPPIALIVTGTAPGPFDINTDEIEPGAIVEYTKDGVIWEIIDSLNIDTFAGRIGSYSIAARQTDPAGNVSPSSTPIAFTVNPACDLTSLSCLNPNGAYTFYKGDILTFQLNFSGTVYTTGAVSMVIENGPTVNFTQITNPAFSLTAAWTVPENVILDPLRIQSIDISNVRSASNNGLPGGDPVVVKDAFNNTRGNNTDATYLKVISRRPTITVSLAMNNGVLAPASNTQSVLNLTFSHAVWPESGMITVKPNGDWHIPPVLTNDDFNTVINALVVTDNATRDTARLQAAYQRTTQGLIQSGTGANATYVPDTSTKYVLDFNTGIVETGTTVHDTVVAALRTAFNNAKYQWQEIEVVSADQVAGSGTTTIQVRLDRLPDGRQWKIEIPAGAFRDEAGNTFAGWATGSNYWFWSQTVATPVIRVNRVSNNRSDTNPTTQTDNTIRTFNFDGNNATVSTTLGTSTENISRTNVQYRIDCETPGASITAGTGASSVATVNTTTTAGVVYRPNSSPNSGANSNNSDATSTQLSGINLTTYTPTNYPTVGDTAINTARKDYIAARASLTGLTQSGRGYEGAFKTVIVYRNVTDQGSRYVKYEGTNVHNGPTTIAGFPMSNNDMTGKGSKYAYNLANNGNGGNDWIWISWEIVSDFWHVGLATNGNTPNSSIDTGEPSAWCFGNDHDTHSFRKYGNWGLRIGN